MPDDDDIFEQAQKALSGAIGTSETFLRQSLGNEVYEELKRRSDAVADLQVLNAHYETKIAEAQVSHVNMKAMMWAALSIAIFVGTAVGFGAFLWWVA